MAQGLILVVMILYFITALDFIRQGQYSMALVFAAYGAANLGLFYASKG